jgi:hypothetical protein
LSEIKHAQTPRASARSLALVVRLGVEHEHALHPGDEFCVDLGDSPHLFRVRIFSSSANVIDSWRLAVVDLSGSVGCG